MSVRPEDVGYDIQCPFCQTIFRGEAATPEPASVAPPAPEPEPEGIEIAPCPKCRAELTVAPSDVGGDVECPFCQTVYLAEKPKPKPNTLLARPSARPAAVLKPPAPPPPPKGKRSGDDDDEKSPIKMKRERDDDDDDDYRPRKKKKKRRGRPSNDPYDPYEDDRYRSMEPSDGASCLIFGLLSFFCCFIIAFWAIPKCRDTMAKVDSGMMDSSAKPLALIGLIFSYLSIAWAILQISFGCLGGFAGGGR